MTCSWGQVAPSGALASARTSSRCTRLPVFQWCAQEPAALSLETPPKTLFRITGPYPAWERERIPLVWRTCSGSGKCLPQNTAAAVVASATHNLKAFKRSGSLARRLRLLRLCLLTQPLTENVLCLPLMSVEDVSDIVFEEEKLKFVQLGRLAEPSIRAEAVQKPRGVLDLGKSLEAAAPTAPTDELSERHYLWQNHCVVAAPLNVLLLATEDRLVRLPLAETLAAAQQYQKPEILRENPFPEWDETLPGKSGPASTVRSAPFDTNTFGAVCDLQVNVDLAVVAVNTTRGRVLLYTLSDLRLARVLPDAFDRLWCWIPETPAGAVLTRRADRCPAVVADIVEASTKAQVLDVPAVQTLVMVPGSNVVLCLVFKNHQWSCVRLRVRSQSVSGATNVTVDSLDTTILQTAGKLQAICRMTPLNASEFIIAYTEQDSLLVSPDTIQFALVRLAGVETSLRGTPEASQVTSFRAPHWITFGEVCPILLDDEEDRSRWFTFLVALPGWGLCVCALAPSDELELLGDSRFQESVPAWRILRPPDAYRAQLPAFENSEYVRILGMDVFYRKSSAGGDTPSAEVFEPLLVVFTNNGLVHWFCLQGRERCAERPPREKTWARAPFSKRLLTLPPATTTTLELRESALDDVAASRRVPAAADVATSTGTATRAPRDVATATGTEGATTRTGTHATAAWNQAPPRMEMSLSESTSGALPEQGRHQIDPERSVLGSRQETEYLKHSAEHRTHFSSEASRAEQHQLVKSILQLGVTDTEAVPVPDADTRHDDEQNILKQIREQQRFMLRQMWATVDQFARLVDLFSDQVEEQSSRMDASPQHAAQTASTRSLQSLSEQIHDILKQSNECLDQCAASIGLVWKQVAPLERQVQLMQREATLSVASTDSDLALDSSTRRFLQHVHQIERQAERVQEMVDHLERLLRSRHGGASLSSHRRTLSSTSVTEAMGQLRYQYGERLRQLYETLFRCSVATAQAEQAWEALAARAQRISELLQDERLPAARAALQRLLSQNDDQEQQFYSELFADKFLVPPGTPLLRNAPDTSSDSRASPTFPRAETTLPSSLRCSRSALQNRVRQALRHQALKQGRDAIGLAGLQTIQHYARSWSVSSTPDPSPGASLSRSCRRSEPPSSQTRPPSQRLELRQTADAKTFPEGASIAHASAAAVTVTGTQARDPGMHPDRKADEISVRRTLSIERPGAGEIGSEHPSASSSITVPWRLKTPSQASASQAPASNDAPATSNDAQRVRPQNGIASSREQAPEQLGHDLNPLAKEQHRGKAANAGFEDALQAVSSLEMSSKTESKTPRDTCQPSADIEAKPATGTGLQETAQRKSAGSPVQVSWTRTPQSSQPLEACPSTSFRSTAAAAAAAAGKFDANERSDTNLPVSRLPEETEPEQAKSETWASKHAEQTLASDTQTAAQRLETTTSLMMQPGVASTKPEPRTKDITASASTEDDTKRRIDRASDSVALALSPSSAPSATQAPTPVVPGKQSSETGAANLPALSASTPFEGIHASENVPQVPEGARAAIQFGLVHREPPERPAAQHTTSTTGFFAGPSVFTNQAPKPVFGAPSTLGSGFGFNALTPGFPAASSSSSSSSIPSTASSVFAAPATTSPVTFGQSLGTGTGTPLSFGALAQAPQPPSNPFGAQPATPGAFGAQGPTNPRPVGFGFATVGAPNDAVSTGSQPPRDNTSWFGSVSAAAGTNRRPLQSPAFTQRRA